jgi:hypothetical protein
MISHTQFTLQYMDTHAHKNLHNLFGILYIYVITVFGWAQSQIKRIENDWILHFIHKSHTFLCRTANPIFIELQRQSLPNKLKIEHDWTDNEYE